ncbi:MAG: DeoR/GlpR transcriptional regulator [Lachnospiraceae bacterium]|nr:DeoR/GlpR transcriptional regulator [Lachnospiraceae bacterium]
MYRNEREHEIIKILSTEKYVTVKQLSTLLYTSESSIRRDLTSLENQGMVARSYGGVELVKNTSQILPFSTRAHHNIAAKKIMAKKAGSLIQDGNIVFLDQSSSAFFVAYELLKKSQITVVTNNIEIIALLSQSDAEVISSGGRLSRSNRNCLVGDDSHHIFSQIHADILFFSAKALSHDGIVYDCAREEVCVRNTMLANAGKKVLLCDSEKFGRTSGYRQCSVRDIDYLITERERQEVYTKFQELPQMIL